MSKKRTLVLNENVVGLVVDAIKEEVEHLTYGIRSEEATLTLDLADYLEFEEIHTPHRKVTELYSTLAVQQLNSHIYSTMDGEVRQVTEFNLHYDLLEETVYVEIGIGTLNLGKIFNPYEGDLSCLKGDK